MILRFARHFLGFHLVLLVCFTPAATPSPARPGPPNLVIFLADDAGWGDYGVHGNQDVRTPHIDSLARDGVSLKWFFVQPVCAPTRAEFLTGRYHPRSGVRGVSTGQERMDLGERTLADGFRSAGYATGAFGKWHNGSQWPYHPQARGFDEYFGHTSGHWGEYVDPPLERNGRMERTQGYIVDVCTDEALEFISRHQDRPFLCYIPFTTPHSPWSVPDVHWRRFRDRPITGQATLPGQEVVDQTRCALAMMENQDDNVGRVLRRLDDLGLRENTIVVYFSDNGPNTWRWNGGMKGRKGGTDDGSVRSPCFIRWPAGLPAGHSVQHVAGAIDLLPTLTALAGIPHGSNRPLDGRDLSPLLRGEPVEWPERLLFAHWAGRTSVRTDRHRLDAAGQLYDVVSDPGQTRNLADAQPDMARRLQEAVTVWRAEVLGEGGLAVPGGAVDPRPIPVGYPEFPIAMLPARDGEPRGGVRRSASAPNSSYFTNWTNTEDRMVWNLQVRTSGEYDVVIDYTCPLADAGSLVAVELGEARTTGRVLPGWDPPLYTHQDTLPRPPAESRLKEFRSLSMGRVRLKEGKGALVLRALEVPGRTVADVRRVTLTLWDSPVKFPERGALPSLFPPDVKSERYDPGEPDYFLFGSPERSLGQIRKIQAAMPLGKFHSPSNNWRHLARTRRMLTEGGRLSIMAIGDSIVNDTMRSGWVELLREAYPRSEITATVYVRGGGGAQHFREDRRLERHVFPRQPNLVLLGGISQRSIEDLEVLVDQLRAGIPNLEILLVTGAFGAIDPRDPEALAAAAYSGTGEYGRRLRALADRKKCAFLDLTTPWAEYLHVSGQHPHRFYRDAVHANEFGEQVLAKILMEFWRAPAAHASASPASTQPAVPDR